MNRPTDQEIAAFSARIKVDLADCYLALPRIQKWGLLLDHPRAGKLARAEANRSIRSEWAGGGVTMPPTDGRSATVDADTAADERDAVNLDQSQMAERFREKKPAKPKKMGHGGDPYRRRRASNPSAKTGGKGRGG